MKFNVNLSPHEKKAIYKRVIEGVEKTLYQNLIMCGIDPDTFDETTFEVQPNEEGKVEPAYEIIKELLDRIAELNAQLKSVE